MANRFSSVDNAQPSQGGRYILPGTYKVRIKACRYVQARKGGEFFVAELEVLESTVADRPPGSTMSWMANLNPDCPGPGNVRAFVALAEGVEVEEVNGEVCEYVVSDANPLDGRELAAVAYNIKTKANTDFTVVDWKLVGGKPAQAPAPAAATPAA